MGRRSDSAMALIMRAGRRSGPVALSSRRRLMNFRTLPTRIGINPKWQILVGGKSEYSFVTGSGSCHFVPKDCSKIRRPIAWVERARPKLIQSPLTNVQATKLQALQNLQGHPMVHWCLAALLPCCLAAMCKGSIRGRGLGYSLPDQSRITPVNILIHFHTFSYIFIHFHTFS